MSYHGEEFAVPGGHKIDAAGKKGEIEFLKDEAMTRAIVSSHRQIQCSTCNVGSTLECLIKSDKGELSPISFTRNILTCNTPIMTLQ